MIRRDQLPQIPSNKVGEFVKFCEEKGVPVEDCGIPPSHIHPIQGEFNREKVDALKKKNTGEWDSLIVASPREEPSSGNTHVMLLDGHHRYIAQKELNPEKNINCLWFHCPIKELVRLGHEFDGSFTKTVHEITTYKQLALARWC